MAHVARVLVPLALLVACKGEDPDETDVDTDCATPTVWYSDSDGDGDGSAATAVSACEAPLGHVATGRDCDDADATVLPAAEEVCNGKDDNCDGVVDPQGAPGSLEVWPDTDEDGAGDAMVASIQACDVPEGFVANDDDCDDGTALAGPTAIEHCDEIDNDCDGVIDGTHAIPRDHATLLDAIDATPDGELICVGPGVFVGGLELVDRELRIEGSGATSTVIDADGAGPTVIVTGGDVTLAGVSLQGGTAGRGAAVRLSDGALALDDVQILDMSFEVDSDELVGLIQASGATLDLTNVAVVGNGLRARETTSGALIVAGAILYATDTAVTWAGGEITSNLLEVALDDNGGQVTIDALLAVSGGSLALSDLVISGNTLIGRSVSTINLGADATVTGLLHATDTDLTFDRVEVVDNDLRADATSPGLDGSRAIPRGWFVIVGGTSTWTEVLFDRNGANALSLEGDATGFGRLSGVTAAWSSVTFSGNTLSHKVYGDAICDGLVLADSTLVADHFDFRGNTVGCGSNSPPTITRGFLYVVSSDGGVTPSSATFTNAIVAGNKVTGRDVVRGPIVVDAASLSFDQASVHGNDTTGAFIDGGVVALYRGATLALDHTTLDGNVATAGSRLYGGVIYDAATADDPDAVFTTRWSNFFGNESKVVFLRSNGDTEVPPSDDGNTIGSPGYVDVSSSDATDWDLHLSSASVLIDQGDPARRDADGSTADIGAYGGPEGAW